MSNSLAAKDICANWIERIPQSLAACKDIIYLETFPKDIAYIYFVQLNFLIKNILKNISE